MLTIRHSAVRFLAGILLAGGLVLSLHAEEKGGMPDLSQEEQTCLPTSTTNLMVWFGLHGYPKLIVKGDSAADGYIHTVHAVMTSVDATYQFGTRTDAIAYGIEKFVRDAGYSCDVEYRGIDWTQAKWTEIVKDEDEEKYKPFQKTPVAFSEDWLEQNDDPNKGFILLLSYCTFDRSSNTFHNAWNAGHAVTLVNAEPNMILIHDPAHDEDEPGRKILTPEVLTGGSFELPGYNAPVAGLMLLSGTLLEAPPDAGVLLTGAVCVTMHPNRQQEPLMAGSPGVSGPPISAPLAGEKNPSLPPPAPKAPATAPAAPSSTSPGTSWGMWLFDLLFKA